MKKPLSPRAKKTMRVLKYIHVILFLTITIVPLGIMFNSQRGLREIKRQMKAEGLPLTPSELNRPLPPAARNAAPLYVQLTELLARSPLKGDAAVLNDVTKQIPPSPEQIAQLRRTLLERQDVVKLVHLAAQMPECVFSRDYTLGPNLMLPEYAQMRAGLRVLTNESIVLLADGKTEEAIRNEALGYRMAQHAASDPILIGKLVGVALNAITNKFMERVLYIEGDTKPDIAAIVAKTIAADCKTVSMADGMRGEVMLGKVTFDMLRDGKLGIDNKDKIPIETTSKPPSYIVRAIMDANELNLLTYQRQSFSLMALSYHQGKAGLEQVDREANTLTWLPTRRMAVILAPVYAQARAKQAQGEAQAKVVETAARIFAYRQWHSAFPYTLNQIGSPLPNDPFSDRTLEYRQVDNGFIVYSVGNSGKFDGGSPERKPDSSETVFRYPMPAYYKQ